MSKRMGQVIKFALQCNVTESHSKHNFKEFVIGEKYALEELQIVVNTIWKYMGILSRDRDTLCSEGMDSK
jgi:hypothetical protein